MYVGLAAVAGGLAYYFSRTDAPVDRLKGAAAHAQGKGEGLLHQAEGKAQGLADRIEGKVGSSSLSSSSSELSLPDGMLIR
jgi:hypothetical protein